MQPLVTIVIPVYNGENFLRTAIESILSQSLSALRIFISDNASEDRTAQIITEFCAKDPRVESVRQRDNIGMIENLSFALQSAQTPYVSFLPHDDFYDSPLALEKALAILEEHSNVSAVYSDMRYVDEYGATLFIRSFRRSGPVKSEVLLRKSIVTTRNMFGIPVLMRTSCARTAVLDANLTYTADVDFSYAISTGGEIYHIPQRLIANRFHSQNLTRKLFLGARAEFKKVAEKHDVRLSWWERAQNAIFSPLIVAQKSLFFFWLACRSRRR